MDFRALLILATGFATACVAGCLDAELAAELAVQPKKSRREILF